MITIATNGPRGARHRYDYHTLAEHVKATLFVVPAAVILLFLILLQRTHSATEWVAAILSMIVLICVAVLGYAELRSTFIEVSDEGILFRSWKKNVFSPWSQIYRIKAVIRSYKIYTRAANFYIRRGIEPVKDSNRDIPDMLARDQSAFSRELIDLVKQRAPHATVVNSILNRPL